MEAGPSFVLFQSIAVRSILSGGCPRSLLSRPPTVDASISGRVRNSIRPRSNRLLGIAKTRWASESLPKRTLRLQGTNAAVFLKVIQEDSDGRSIQVTNGRNRVMLS